MRWLAFLIIFPLQMFKESVALYDGVLEPE